MKTLILTLCLLLLPCAAGAGAVRIPTEYDPKANILWIDISKTLEPAIPRPMTMELQNDTETLAVIDKGTLIIQHGACEKLGLKHAWGIYDGILDDSWITETELMNTEIRQCENCGLVRKLVPIRPAYHYEYR